jgi:hypothetical protein
MTNDEWSQYHVRERELPDGRVLVVYPITFGRARIGVAPYRGALTIDDLW